MEEKTKYGVLTIRELKMLNLFSAENNDLYEECYSNASFDFTLGDEFFFPEQYQDALKQTVIDLKLKNTAEIPGLKRNEVLKSQIRSCKANNRILVLPKFSSVVISTYEIVTLPINVAGRFDLRVKWAMAGLVLQVGAQIEPGYSGRLWGLLHNFSGEDVSIGYHYKDHRLLTGEFYFTCEDAEPSKEKLIKPSTLLELLTKYPVKSGSLQNYFEEFKNIQNSFEKEVQKEISTITRSREEYRTSVSNKIKSELETIANLKEDVLTVKAEAKDLTTEARNLIDKVNERRNFTLSIAIAIISFGLAIGLPLTIPWASQQIEGYYKDTKLQNQAIDSLKTNIDSLNRKIVDLSKQIAKVNTVNKSSKIIHKRKRGKKL